MFCKRCMQLTFETENINGKSGKVSVSRNTLGGTCKIFRNPLKPTSFDTALSCEFEEDNTTSYCYFKCECTGGADGSTEFPQLTGACLPQAAEPSFTYFTMKPSGVDVSYIFSSEEFNVNGTSSNDTITGPTKVTLLTPCCRSATPCRSQPTLATDSWPCPSPTPTPPLATTDLPLNSTIYLAALALLPLSPPCKGLAM